MSIFKDCDIRGIYPTEIDDDAAYLIGRALSTLHPGARLCVGGDVRISTPAIKAAFIRGLSEGGARVVDIGVIPTPALYFALSSGDYDGGATVTASHNPPQYNGIKFMFGPDPVTRADIDAVRALVKSGDFANAPGEVSHYDLLPDYIESMVRRFKAHKPLKILVDAGNGAMSAAAPEALRRCGYEVVELFCEEDGAFPGRDPNPADYSHLDAARAKVVESGADFGVAFDGDGDRAVFIDETGRAVENERSLALFIRRLLRNRPTAVVYDQKCSSAVKRAALEMGGDPAPERSGHAFIKRHFLRDSAAIAGEVSGHFFFGELGYDDGLFAALMMADIVAESGLTLSHLVSDIVIPPITPDLRVYCPYAEMNEWLRRIEALAEGRPCAVSKLDGVRLDFPDGWLLVRKSVTAEQITFRAEADSPERLREILQMAADVLPEAAGQTLLHR